MELGTLLPHMGRSADPSAIREVALAAERLGFAALWVGDHIVFPQEQRSRYPYSDAPAFPMPPERPFLESFTTLAFVAALTERVRLGVSVCAMPYRNPLLLAKVVATLDFLSKGRVILGVGEGYLEDEFEALQVPFAERRARTDEALEILRGAWYEPGAFSYRGRFYTFDRIMVRPHPVQPRIPIWVGGNTARARARAAEHGDAWQPMLWHMSPDDIARHLPGLREARARLNHDPRSLEVTLFASTEIRGDDDPRPPWETGYLRGTPRRVAEYLLQYEAAGVTHVVLALGGGSASRIRAMEDLATEIRQLSAHSTTDG